MSAGHKMSSFPDPADISNQKIPCLR